MEDVIKKPNDFHVDRLKIAESQIVEAREGLAGLENVNAYVQDDYEQGILNQVDEAIETADLNDRVLTLNVKLSGVLERLRKLDSKEGTSGKLLSEQSSLLAHKAEIESQLADLKTQLTDLVDLADASVAPDRLSKSASENICGSLDSVVASKKNQSEHARKGPTLAFTDFEQFLSKKHDDSLVATRIKRKTSKRATTRPSTSSPTLDIQSDSKLSPANHDFSGKPPASVLVAASDSDNFFDGLPRKRRKPTGKIIPEWTGELSGSIAGDSKKMAGLKLNQKSAVSKKQSMLDPNYDCSSEKYAQDHSGDNMKQASDGLDGYAGSKNPKQGNVKTSVSPRDDGSDAAYSKRLRNYQKDILLQKKARIDQGWDGTDSEEEDEVELEGGLCVPLTLWNKLYKFQKTGVRWLWELHQQTVGGILGDEMGLGKTIQIIAFLVALKESALEDVKCGHRRGLGPVLIVAPATVMHQWVREFHKWWPMVRVAVMHNSGSYGGKKKQLVAKIYSRNGILVTSYSGVTLHRELLQSYDWHYVILDEGHKIRNPDAQITLAVKKFRTPHRLILSGSPLQNSLRELWSLLDFCYPGRLGTLPVFMEEFSVPITQGGYASASKVQVQTAYRCACVLREAIGPYLLRRMKKDVQLSIQLPAKNEQVLFCRITDEQRTLYKAYLSSRDCSSILTGKCHAFAGLITLRKICNHPDLVDGGPNKLGNLDEFSDPTVKYGYAARSGKMIVIEALLKLWKTQGHRVLLFSQSKQMLDILSMFLTGQQYSFMRMDGGTNIGSRQRMVQTFNTNPSIFVFLLTTRVGGLGLNLTGGDRVVIFDPDWNPSTDSQARERAWRIGQDKPVTVYRLLTTGTIEEKIYQRQIFKHFLTNRILSDPRQRRFFKTNDLHELFTLGDDGSAGGSETSSLFAGTGSSIDPSKVAKAVKRKQRKSKVLISQQTSNVNASESSTLQSENENVQLDVNNWFDRQLLAKEDAHLESGGQNGSEKGSKLEELDEEDIDYIPLGEQKKIEDARIKRLQQMAKRIANQMKKQQQINKEANELINHPCFEAEAKGHRKHKHKKHKKHKKEVEVEGSKITHVSRQEVYRRPDDPEDGDEGGMDDKTQDDYVLNSLFKHSGGIQSALQHDTIMDYSSRPDYDIVEGEAARVAQRAAKALAASRQQCLKESTVGVPTWTGSHGRLGAPSRMGGTLRQNSSSNPFLGSSKTRRAQSPPRIRKGKSLRRLGDKPVEKLVISTKPDHLRRKEMIQSVGQNRRRSTRVNDTAEDEDQLITAVEIFEEIKSRQMAHAVFDQFEPDPYDSDYEGMEPNVLRPAQRIGRPVALNSRNNNLSEDSQSKDYSAIMEDIRVFIAFQADSTDGQATTSQILDKFKDKFTDEEAPILRSILKELCNFVRSPSAGASVWRLKDNHR